MTSKQTDNMERWEVLSSEHTIWESEWGQVCLFSGCSGRFYDLYDPKGVYITTVATLESAQALLKQHAATGQAVG